MDKDLREENSFSFHFVPNCFVSEIPRIGCVWMAFSFRQKKSPTFKLTPQASATGTIEKNER